MTTATEISPGLLPAGLFLLKLQSETHLEGAPLLGLTLTVYTGLGQFRRPLAITAV
jgi:hypothetical protein